MSQQNSKVINTPTCVAEFNCVQILEYVSKVGKAWQDQVLGREAFKVDVTGIELLIFDLD
jgi:hypothetical protein